MSCRYLAGISLASQSKSELARWQAFPAEWNAVEFGILGPLCMAARGRDLELPPMQRTVLAALLLDANRIVPMSRLISALWRSGPDHWTPGPIRSSRRMPWCCSVTAWAMAVARAEAARWFDLLGVRLLPVGQPVQFSLEVGRSTAGAGPVPLCRRMPDAEVWAC